MMTLILKRKAYRNDGIFSELQTESGEKLCVTLEHSYFGTGNAYVPKIPGGTYLCVRGSHRLHADRPAFDTYEVTGVSGHQGILFHCGNTENDSEGCILLGKEAVEKDALRSLICSRDAFKEFMARVGLAQSFILKVIA